MRLWLIPEDDLKLRSVMAALAYQAHRASSEKNGTGTLLRKDALDLLEKAEQLGDIRLASEFLDYVDQRAGLLIGNGGELAKAHLIQFPAPYLSGIPGRRSSGSPARSGANLL